ncbi:MAG: hypothetical protein PHY93_07030 [Bacteriovorax sp.]|nr:hypothetical protein [Bacteriovorax sp.]
MVQLGDFRFFLAFSRHFKKEGHDYRRIIFLRSGFIKLITGLGLILLISNSSFAEDTVKVTVGTQSYHCDLGAELSCKAVNEVQQKAIVLKKNGGQVGVEDKARGLNADAVTSLNGTNVVYDVTICSGQSCSISTVTSDSTGKINQVISGQYNITQKSFDVLGFFISTQAGVTELQEIILQKLGQKLGRVK